MINFVWKIYTKLVNYDQKVKDEFEYELVKKLEQQFYNRWKATEKTGAKSGGDFNDWLVGYDAGRASVFKDIWNTLSDRYFDICKDRNCLDEFKALKASRNTDEQDETDGN